MQIELGEQIRQLRRRDGRTHIKKLYLYLSRVQWERGYHDDAFVSLDEALKHARALEALLDGKEHSFTAPLVMFVKYKTGSCGKIARTLPEDWPLWCNPDYSQVEKEIKVDPRWAEWVEKCRALSSTTPRDKSQY